MFSQLLKSLSWLTATESATQIQVASATAAPSALVTVFVKELGGELQVFKDVSPNEYVGSFRRLLPSRELSPKSTLFHITDAALWARITADPAAETAFLSSSPKPEPVHGESPVLAGMRLLAVPPDVFKGALPRCSFPSDCVRVRELYPAFPSFFRAVCVFACCL